MAKKINITYTTGAVPSPHDSRDYQYEKLFKAEIGEIGALDYRDLLKEVRDQGSQGTCVAMAGTCMKEGQECTDINIKEYQSPQFIYNQRSNKSSGMYPRDLMKILKNIGSVFEADYPYMSHATITKELKDSAKRFDIKSYAKITTIEGLRDSLKNNGICVLATPVYDYGMKMWIPDSSLIGYHMMAVVGFDDNKEQFIIRNSWGTQWGDKGYCYLPYGEFKYITEVWTSIDNKTITKVNKFKLFLKKFWYKFKQPQVWITTLILSLMALIVILGLTTK